MTRRLSALSPGLLLIAWDGVAAQPVGPPAPITAPRDCVPSDDQGEDIVVCGRSDEDSPYRLPRQFRNQPSVDDRDAAWSARVRDEQSLQAFDSQTVGPFGYLQHSREVDCQWRAARQEAQGRRPDCTRQIRPIGPIGR